VEEVAPLIVKKDGRREAFDRSKILNGIIKACEKRPVSLNQIEKLVERVERRVQDSGDKEIQSSQIGQELIEQDKQKRIKQQQEFRGAISSEKTGGQGRLF
jgi:transcriptional repressor NrdR